MKKLIFTLIFISACAIGIFAQNSDTQTKIADKWPMFPGCENLDGTDTEIRQCADQKLFSYIDSNLEYPELAKANKVEGTVMIKFKVDKEGILSTPVIVDDIGAGCGEAALAVMNKMIKENIHFIPAELEGKSVEMEIALPFRFVSTK